MTPLTSAADNCCDTAVATQTATIKVTIFNDGRQARIQPDEIFAQHGDTVEWLFENVPAGFEPMIQFTATTVTSTTSTIFTGPLESICRTPESISGVVRDDVQGKFPYRVVLIPRPGFGSGIRDLTVGDPAAIFIGVDDHGDPQSSG